MVSVLMKAFMTTDARRSDLLTIKWRTPHELSSERRTELPNRRGLGAATSPSNEGVPGCIRQV